MLQLTMLNNKQKYAFEKIIRGSNVFITGPGGTGKSFLINYYVNFLKTIDTDTKDYAITSTTGLSAKLINGTTLHSFAGIGHGNDSFEILLDRINNNYFSKKRWKQIKILLIDEVSMLSPRLFEKLDALARKIRRNSKPFGGIQIILFGDFFQLPTVNSDHFCFEAFNWDDTINEVIVLEAIVRQKDNKFQNCLNKIRFGIVDNEVLEILNSRKINSFHKTFKNKNTIILPTILYARKVAVNKYNNKKLEQHINNGYKYNIYDCIYEYSKNISEPLKLFLRNNINKSLNIPDKLKLSIHSQVMITINMKDEKLVNGSRGIIVDFDKKNNPIVEFLDGRKIIIKQHDFEYEDYNKNKIIKKQYPLKLAWALTIHKSQGMSLDYVCTDIGESIFEYGQVYVVLSRVRNLEGLFIKNIDYEKIKAHPKVIHFYKNIKEIKNI